MPTKKSFNYARFLKSLSRNRLPQILHILNIYFIIQPVTNLCSRCLIFLLRLNSKWNRKLEWLFYSKKPLHYWKSNKNYLLKSYDDGYKTKIEDLGLTEDNLKLLKKDQKEKGEIIIAEIDQDGLIVSNYGPFHQAPTIPKDQFIKRNRYCLQIVALKGDVGVKKYFDTSEDAFLNEVMALHKLTLAGCRTPAVMDVGFKPLTLTFSYIQGITLREALAKEGALLRDRDVKHHPDFINLTENQSDLKRIEEGKRVLDRVIEHSFVDTLFAELKKIHAANFVYADIKYGNIIIEKNSNTPYLIDFEDSRYCTNRLLNRLKILQDRDIENLNLHFGTEIMTRKRIMGVIQNSKTPCYSPAYIGFGLILDKERGSLSHVNVGYGRWNHFLKEHLPPLSGKRILDLGTNNSFNALQMLRHGAREVIGVEMDDLFISQGDFIKKSFEWADDKQYCFNYIQGNMKAIESMDLGKFDFVQALCSIYYLDDEQIQTLVKHISSITDTMVLQCNLEQDIGRGNVNTYRKASLEYACDVLKENGFPSLTIINPPKYSRPLVIGRKESVS